MSNIKSFTDESVEYIVNLVELSCTCKDWILERCDYSRSDPRRLCKHLIKEIIEKDFITKDNDLKFFKSEIENYYNRNIGFAKNYIFKDLETSKILYVIDGARIKIYDNTGSKLYYDSERFSSDSRNYDLTEIEYRFIRIDTEDTKEIIINKIQVALNKFLQVNNIVLNGFKINAYSSLENNDFENIQITASIKLNTNKEIKIFDFNNTTLDIGMYGGIVAYLWVDLNDLYKRLT